METQPSQNKAAKLLGVAFPSILDVKGTLQPIMEKYNIPIILPENKELAKTVRAERTDEEWAVIRGEIEANLRKRFDFIPAGLKQLYNFWRKNPEGYLKIKGLSKLPTFLGGPISKLLTTLRDR